MQLNLNSLTYAGLYKALRIKLITPEEFCTAISFKVVETASQGEIS